MDFHIFQNKITDVAENIIIELKNIDSLSADTIDDEQVSKIVAEMHDDIVIGSRKIRSDINGFVGNFSCDTLNIGFFGETNAGKSTLIEALCRGDGSSIGDGRKDFTREIRPEKLNGITLYDMPGIEGDESRFAKEIKATVQKCQIIFYVLGLKEPEAGTMAKVREYLGRESSLYYIVNVRLKPSAYKYRMEKDDDALNTVSRRTGEKMRSVLGGFVRGGIVANAQLAFVAGGKPSRSDFISERNKAEEVFGSLEAARKNSQIGMVESLLSNLQSEAPKEIIRNNTYKLMRTLEDVMAGLQESKEKFDDYIKLMKFEAVRTHAKIDSLVEQYEKEVNAYLLYWLIKTEADIKEEFTIHIDNNRSVEYINVAINAYYNTYISHIREGIEAKTIKLSTDIKEELNKFRARVELAGRINTFKSEFDFTKMLNNLNRGFFSILSEVVDVGTKIVSAFFANPWLGVATGIAAIAKTIWENFLGGKDKKKRDLKRETNDYLTQQFAIIRQNITRDFCAALQQTKIEVDKSFRQVEPFFEALSRNETRFNDIILNLGQFKVYMSILLVNYIAEVPVEHAYIDAKLQKMVVVGPCANDAVQAADFGLLQVFPYLSLSQFSSSIGRIGNVEGKSVQFFHGNEEILFRAACAFRNQLNVRIVEKEEVSA